METLASDPLPDYEKVAEALRRSGIPACLSLERRAASPGNPINQAPIERGREQAGDEVLEVACADPAAAKAEVQRATGLDATTGDQVVRVRGARVHTHVPAVIEALGSSWRIFAPTDRPSRTCSWTRPAGASPWRSRSRNPRAARGGAGDEW